jgi:hypothetical protein
MRDSFLRWNGGSTGAHRGPYLMLGLTNDERL